MEAFPPGDFGLFVAAGYRDLNKLREVKCTEAKAKGYELVSYMSSKASHWGDAKVGENCFISENCTIQPFVTIGDGVIMYGGCHIGHDASIGDWCYLSPRVVLCGEARIGRRCFLGGNALVRDGITVADDNIVGAQAAIMSDTEPKQVFVARRTEPYRLDADQFLRTGDI
ncbi:MAG: acetyltransferase [Planctomycetota bacterium]